MLFQTVIQIVLRRRSHSGGQSPSIEVGEGQPKKNRLPLLIALMLVLGVMLALVLLFPHPGA